MTNKIFEAEERERNKAEKIPALVIMALIVFIVIVFSISFTNASKDWDNRIDFEEKCSDLGYNKSYYYSGNVFKKSEYYCIKTENGIEKSRLDIYDVEEFLRGKQK